MRILIGACFAAALSVSMQSQIGASQNSATQILAQSQVEVAQLSLTAPPVQLQVALPPSVPYEFRGIRIGDEKKVAEQKFLSWKVPSLSFEPGLCGSDGIYRVETCTGVLETGQYVNMTILDQQVAQIYVSTDSRAEGNTYDSYMLCSAEKFGRPDKIGSGQNRSRVETEFSGEGLRWSKGDQYIKASRGEHSFTIGNKSLGVEMDKLEKIQQF
jgi:hypothetical protein